MLVSRWGNSLAVRLPRALVKDLGLKPGDELEVVAATQARVVVARDDRRAQAVERMRARGLHMPESYAFDRDDANARWPPHRHERARLRTGIRRFYDALIVASALDAGCGTLLTEDLQTGRIGRLTIVNPFV